MSNSSEDNYPNKKLLAKEFEKACKFFARYLVLDAEKKEVGCDEAFLVNAFHDQENQRWLCQKFHDRADYERTRKFLLYGSFGFVLLGEATSLVLGNPLQIVLSMRLCYPAIFATMLLMAGYFKNSREYWFKKADTEIRESVISTIANNACGPS